MIFGIKRGKSPSSNIEKRRLETRAIFNECQSEFPDTTENSDRFDAAAKVVIDCFVAKIGAPDLTGEWWNIAQPDDEQKAQILFALERLSDLSHVESPGVLDKHFPELARIYLTGVKNTEVHDPEEIVSSIDAIILWGGADQIREFVEGGLGVQCLTLMRTFSSPYPSLDDLLSSIEYRDDLSGKAQRALEQFKEEISTLQVTWLSESFLKSSFSEIARHISENVELPLDMSVEGKSVEMAFSRWEETYLPNIHMAKAMKYAPKHIEQTHVWSELFDDASCVGYLVPGFISETPIGYYICEKPWEDSGTQERVLTEISRICRGCDGSGEIDGEECIVCEGETDEVVTMDVEVQYRFDRADELNSQLEAGIETSPEDIAQVSTVKPGKVSKFCTECGGAFLNEQAKFCAECGASRA